MLLNPGSISVYKADAKPYALQHGPLLQAALGPKFPTPLRKGFKKFSFLMCRFKAVFFSFVWKTTL